MKDNANTSQFRTELQIHAKMQHPNIVEFYRAFAFEDHTYVVLELCSNGSLMEMVKSRSCLSLPEVRRYMIQLCGGVKYMHQRSVIHRDLKMGNLFLDARMNLKIGDFGLAAIVVSDRERRQTLCGTPNYIAPEILDKKASGGHDHKVDTWAVGIICYAMLTGGPPFASKTQPEIYAKLKQLEYSWKTDGLNYIPREAKDLVVACLNLTAHARPDMDDLVEHEFFKMGSIAEEMSADCRSNIPAWLENADPRGDRVASGFGVAHEIICAACGVGKMSNGMSRPSVGVNVSKSTITEVEAENREGFAPVVPLPPGMIYRQFAAAKEDWTIARKYPITATHVRSRKNGATTGMMNMNSIATALPETATATVPSSSLPVRAPAQSFAAQQRQQAVSSRAVSRKQTQQVDNNMDEILTQPRQHIVSSRAISRKQTQHLDNKEDEMSIKGNVPSTESGRGYLRERPLRSTSGMSTRTNSSREAVPTRPMLTKSTTISEGMGRHIKSQVKIDLENASQEVPRPTTLTRTASVRHALKDLTESSSSAKSSSSPPTSSDSKENQAPAPMASDPKQEKSRSVSRSSKEDKATAPVPNVVKEEKPRSTSTSVTLGHAPESRPRLVERLVDPAERSALLKSSKPREVLSALRMFRESLSDKIHVAESHASPYSRSHPIVEKWVDYAGRYGIAYILTDHSVGCVFNGTGHGSRPTSCIVVRDGRNHYINRIRQPPEKKPQQFLPFNEWPVEFYEHQGSGVLRKAIAAGKKFEMNVDAFGDRAMAQLIEERLHTVYEQEKLRLVVLCDKFGKYMGKTIDTEDIAWQGQSDSDKATTPKRFVKFFQRLGNVGIWGFSAASSTAPASDSLSFQFNFPDHTKLVLYQNGTLLDLYHLHPDDIKELQETGNLHPAALERREITLRLRVSDIINADRPSSTFSASAKASMACNQVREKLEWVKKVIEIWIREGGLGKMGKYEDKFYWTGLQEASRSKLVWVCVGREDGDGPATGTLSAAA